LQAIIQKDVQLAGISDKETISSTNGLPINLRWPFTKDEILSIIDKNSSNNQTGKENHFIFTNEEVEVDLSMLDTISPGDEEFIKKMVQTFVATMPSTVQKIETYTIEKNWKEVYLSAHFAKSSLSVIKIPKMYNCVLKIELQARNETHLDTIPALVEKAKKLYSSAEELMSQKFNVEVNRK
jgi:HPt (histidine-containing phosphotransfer) domain-containing protein